MQRSKHSNVQSYRDVIVWQKAMDLVIGIYRCTDNFPRNETYGLTSQLRRAAVSIPSNIAEGHDRLSRGEFRQFLGYARGSLVEIETQIIIARSLGYLDVAQSSKILERTTEVGKILNGLINSIAHRRQKAATGFRALVPSP